MLTIIHDITTNNIGSLCYHNTYKYVDSASGLIPIIQPLNQVYQIPPRY